MLTASLYSPLEKFLLGRPVEAQPYTKASCLGGEEFAFQVVLQRDGWDITPVQVEAASPLGGGVPGGPGALRHAGLSRPPR